MSKRDSDMGYRYFGKLRYEEVARFKSKAKAKKRAKSMRARGSRARVTKADRKGTKHDVYIVWDGKDFKKAKKTTKRKTTRKRRR